MSQLEDLGKVNQRRTFQRQKKQLHILSQSDEVSDEIEIMQDVPVDVGNDEHIMACELVHETDADSDYTIDFDSDGEDINAIFDMIKKY